ncbi:MAG: FRG domain-containing protein [Colwellia sp.]|nr:FRG domain-containing protein [Colwellia sp.]
MPYPTFPHRAWYEKELTSLDEIKKQLSAPVMKSTNRPLFYRGMSNKEHICISTFYRYFCDNFTGKWEERSICFKTKISLPILPEQYIANSFSVIDSLKSELESSGISNLSLNSLMYLAQHYGLPTNLIDFTTDPKIALYFACSRDYEKDAVIYMTDIYEHVDISAYMLINGQYRVCNDDGSIMSTGEINEVAIKHGTEIQQNSSDLITPIINQLDVEINARIQNQSGAFVYNGQDHPFDLNMYCSSSSTDHFGRQAFIIKSELKDGILNWLNCEFGINKSFIYPPVSSRIEETIIKAADKIKSNLTNIVKF